ncbi:MAG TPA: long-chain-acyl-CoA synthetase [Phenylobacterium sp.]|uniref:long-chain-acyl-CoA synthetase n=1 Tax=Phenylobacterium sp. TaxID=1871053 RepID=UPI002B4AA823|nr:long-chain-acyl-CoA synthetase [Phenylobacterium sp.]HKR88547.1 long-chain-acyl-CoA synthetase [Phenylobacterium sp.]
MRLNARLKREWRFLRGLLRTLARVKGIEADSANLLCDDLEAAVAKWRDRPAITFEGRTLTYGELDALANRYAHWGKSLNLRRGQTVALFMPNRIEYFAIWYGLSKIGVVTALINNQLSGLPLAHCLNISGASHLVMDAETAPVFEAARPLLEKAPPQWVLGPAPGEHQRDLAQALKSCSQLPPDRNMRKDLKARDTLLLIFTSGTTGMPKAARITHVRGQLYMRGFAGSTDARESDRIYVSLPLYHATGGLCALGAALLNGGSVVLKRRFSASHFWQDVAAEGCTMFVYIGELCRYLVNQPASDLETRHKLRLAFGNGLRPDIWPVMKQRFKIPEILEFYGSTEGNVSLFNFDGREGAVGRAPKWLRGRFNVRVIQFDVEGEKPIRGTNGFCIEAGAGQVGECIGKIGGDARAQYTGYVDKAASDKKVLHDVFEKGDAWFATGDLMRIDADGYLYFVDRIGDTFRWKGENVSTNEVAERLQAAPGVLQANVFGVAVEGAEGRAGMAALVVDQDFDIRAFGEHVATELPIYAQPLFVRILPAMDTTGTFKMRKMDLVADGYDPAKVRGPLYFHDPKRGYVKVTKAVYDKIATGLVKV